VTTLDRAVTLPQRNTVALRVGKDLDLDMTGALKPTLHKDLIVAKRLGSLTLSRANLLDKVLDVVDNTHTLTTTTVGRLDEEGESDVGCGLGEDLFTLLGTMVTRNTGDARSEHDLLALALAAHGPDGLGRRADELEPGSGDGSGKLS
jgi:hypothetical protein